MSYRLLSYLSSTGEPRAGLLVGDEIYDLAAATAREAHTRMMSVLADWSAIEPQLERVATQRPEGAHVGQRSGVRLTAPLPEAGAIFCAAANFRDHMLAMARKLGVPPEPDPRKLDVKPYHFLKPSRQVIAGPDAVVELPSYAKCIDWEIELVAVIGKPAKNVDVADALAHVAGYTVGNDLSVRDRQFMRRTNVPDGSLFKTDFLGMKAFDHSCPIGPWIVPARAIRDPQALAMKLWVDGELKQDSSTAHMIFSVAEQIAQLSTYATLLPGDLILTGTPAGTGAESDVFLRPGQSIRAWIEDIGELNTTIACS